MSLQHRYDFVLLFDVKDGNPNGDPDAGNLPRVDPETGQGLVTDVALKRKLRNYVGLAKEEQPPYEIYVKEKAVLNLEHVRAYEGIDAKDQLEQDNKGHWKSKGKGSNDEARNWMCKNFYDVRTFGAVMSTGVNCGQVRGPVQLTFSRSIDPIIAQEHSITRMAVTKEADLEKERTMGRKFTIPYGLYVAHGFISAHLAGQTGFSDEDLELLWQGLMSMFEHDRSAARGEMSSRGLYVFEHDGKLGNAPAHRLFETISAELKPGIAVPRQFADYQVNVAEDQVPDGVTLQRKLG